MPFPHVYRLDESIAVWRSVEAPVLWVAATESEIPQWIERNAGGDVGTDGLAGVRRRMAHLRNARLATIADAGHMLHHDQPAAVAAAIEPFLVS
jgi:pimeloyl-ACP methyl ester carboxylesterase